MKKSQFRLTVENIINDQRIYQVYVDSTNFSYVRGTDKANGNYRMKLYGTYPATPAQVKKLMALPHVYKVGYRTPNEMDYTWGGITIYVDCKPSTIKLPKINLKKS